MPIGMTVTTAKGNKLKIQGLDPFKVIMEETYRVRKGFVHAHEDTNMSIGGVSAQLRFFSNFYKFPQPLSYVSERFFVPIF